MTKLFRQHLLKIVVFFVCWLPILGSGQDSTSLITGAGYGVLFVNSPGSQISNLKITGGHRDRDGNATDAAIVVRNSKVAISKCLITDNMDRPDSLVLF